MDEQGLRGLIADVKAGKLSRADCHQLFVEPEMACAVPCGRSAHIRPAARPKFHGRSRLKNRRCHKEKFVF